MVIFTYGDWFVGRMLGGSSMQKFYVLRWSGFSGSAEGTCGRLGDSALLELDLVQVFLDLAQKLR